MNDLTDTTLKQMLRGMILRICKELSQTGAGTRLIYLLISKQDYGFTSDDVVEACIYLQDKEFVKIKRVSHSVINLERDIVYITAKGIDLLEKSISADGIILE